MLSFCMFISMPVSRLPWFRVHIVILNDPGRIISVHLMHCCMVCGWAGVMSIYELVIWDPSDPIGNPYWRQGCYLCSVISRIGVDSSAYDWSIGLNIVSQIWSYEVVCISHVLLSGLFVLSAYWHWSYWNIGVFFDKVSGQLVLDFSKMFGIHLFLSALVCFGFGYGHLSGFFGPGMWTSDAKGLVGSVRLVKPSYSLTGLSLSSYGCVVSHHIVSGFLGIILGIWHISSRPVPFLFYLNQIGSIESVLATSLASVLFASFISAATMWYGSVTTPLELFGPTRYHWDNGYFAQDIESRVKFNMDSNGLLFNQSWELIPDRLVLYDYIGSNPAKGGLFRSGPVLRGDGIVQSWLGHTNFELGLFSLNVRRMPAFFETFPVILIDLGGTLRADIPFRRAVSMNSLEQVKVVLYFSGGVLDSTEYITSSIVKAYARKSQFGEIFAFDYRTCGGDGVFRATPRGWHAFAHTCFAFLFFFGHLWHASRALFRDVWRGVNVESLGLVEYGRNETISGSSLLSNY